MAHIIIVKKKDIDKLTYGDTYIVLPDVRIDPETYMKNIDDINKLEELIQKKFNEEIKNAETDSSSKSKIHR